MKPYRFSLLVPICFCGCKLADKIPFLSPSSTNKQESTIEKQIWELDGKVNGVNATLHNNVLAKSDQIVNQLWPIVVMIAVVGILIIIGGLGGLVLVAFVAYKIIHSIRKHSYLAEKPQWEGLKGSSK